MRRTRRQRLEARRRDLEDQVVVYALTGRQPPPRLVMAYVQARRDVEAVSRGEAAAGGGKRHGLFDRWFGHPAAG